MTKYVFYIITFFMSWTTHAQITMTTQKTYQRIISLDIEGNVTDTIIMSNPVSFNIEEGHGYMSVDWGDGTKFKIFILFKRGFMWGDGLKFRTHKPYYYVHFRHNYDDTIQSHVITLRGRNIKLLDCQSLQLTSLDVSKSAKLKGLRCSYNKLTSLDVSKNTRLEWLTISNNQLSSDSLNFLFETLNDNKNSDWNHVTIFNNPGVYDCNIEIAEKKRWSVTSKW